MLKLSPKFNTTFFERYAKISLVDLLGSKYEGLENSDRPDLQDCNRGIGIEVTRAIEETQIAAVQLINEVSGISDFEECLHNENFEIIKNMGYGYGISPHFIGTQEYDYWSLALPLKRIIESKVRKVADGFYGNFDEYGLFVFSKDDLMFPDAMNAMEYTVNLQLGNSLAYKKMFIFDTKSLFVCELDSELLTQISVSPEQCEFYYKTALQK